jgi:hypothetical protein
LAFANAIMVKVPAMLLRSLSPALLSKYLQCHEKPEKKKAICGAFPMIVVKLCLYEQARPNTGLFISCCTVESCWRGSRFLNGRIAREFAFGEDPVHGAYRNRETPSYVLFI